MGAGSGAGVGVYAGVYACAIIYASGAVYAGAGVYAADATNGLKGRGVVVLKNADVDGYCCGW